jgi:hypothetical protein
MTAYTSQIVSFDVFDVIANAGTECREERKGPCACQRCLAHFADLDRDDQEDVADTPEERAIMRAG